MKHIRCYQIQTSREDEEVRNSDLQSLYMLPKERKKEESMKGKKEEEQEEERKKKKWREHEPEGRNKAK